MSAKLHEQVFKFLEDYRVSNSGFEGLMTRKMPKKEFNRHINSNPF